MLAKEEKPTKIIFAENITFAKEEERELIFSLQRKYWDARLTLLSKKEIADFEKLCDAFFHRADRLAHVDAEIHAFIIYEMSFLLTKIYKQLPDNLSKYQDGKLLPKLLSALLTSSEKISIKYAENIIKLLAVDQYQTAIDATDESDEKQNFSDTEYKTVKQALWYIYTAYEKKLHNLPKELVVAIEQLIRLQNKYREAFVSEYKSLQDQFYQLEKSINKHLPDEHKNYPGVDYFDEQQHSPWKNYHNLYCQLLDIVNAIENDLNNPHKYDDEQIKNSYAVSRKLRREVAQQVRESNQLFVYEKHASAPNITDTPTPTANTLFNIPGLTEMTMSPGGNVFFKFFDKESADHFIEKYNIPEIFDRKLGKNLDQPDGKRFTGMWLVRVPTNPNRYNNYTNLCEQAKQQGCLLPHFTKIPNETVEFQPNLKPSTFFNNNAAPATNPGQQLQLNQKPF